MKKSKYARWSETFCRELMAQGWELLKVGDGEEVYKITNNSGTYIATECYSKDLLDNSQSEDLIKTHEAMFDVLDWTDEGVAVLKRNNKKYCFYFVYGNDLNETINDYTWIEDETVQAEFELAEKATNKAFGVDNE
jgi:hypothetical protein